MSISRNLTSKHYSPISQSTEEPDNDRITSNTQSIYEGSSYYSDPQTIDASHRSRASTYTLQTSSTKHILDQGLARPCLDRYPQGLTSTSIVGSKDSVLQPTPPTAATTTTTSTATITQLTHNSTLQEPTPSPTRLLRSGSETSSVTSNKVILDNAFSPFGGYPQSDFPLRLDEPEQDDYLHNPDPILDNEYEKHRFKSNLKDLDKKSLILVAGLFFVCIGGLIVLFILPVLT